MENHCTVNYYFMVISDAKHFSRCLAACKFSFVQYILKYFDYFVLN